MNSSGFWVASAQANSVFLLEPLTGKVDQIIQNVPDPQDAVASSPVSNGEVVVAADGGMDSISWVDISGNVRTVPGIPEPTALALDVVLSPSAVPELAAALVTSTSTDSLYVVYLPVVTTPQQSTISNGASFANGATNGTPQGSPGTLVSAFAATGVSQNFSATSLPLPESLGGVSLSVGGMLNFDSGSDQWTYSSTGGMPAPLLFVGPNQINFQVPPGIAPGTAVPVQLTMPNGSTQLATLNVGAASPGIFTLTMNGQGQAAVLNQDNSLNGPTIFVGANPAARGSVIQIYATGAGATTPALMPGEPAPASGNPLVVTNVQPTVTIGGVQATVEFSGMAPGFVGLWQINAVVPQSVTPGTAVPLTISAGGNTSNTVTIAVQ